MDSEAMDLEQASTGAAPAQSVRRAAPLTGRTARSADRPPEPAERRLASTLGNRNLARVVARMQAGEGILAGGVVHPDIEAAIALAGGSGRSLDRDVAAEAGSTFGDSFSDVRIHDDTHAAALSNAVSARAFTVGTDIFFAAGEYSPGTTPGRELLTHELTHVVQQRGAPQNGPLTVSQPEDPLEREADAAARRIA